MPNMYLSFQDMAHYHTWEIFLSGGTFATFVQSVHIIPNCSIDYILLHHVQATLQSVDY